MRTVRRAGGAPPTGTRPRWLPQLCAFVLAVVALLRVASARASEPGDSLTVSLLTMGPGEHPFTKFGHSAIWVHDAQTNRD